MSQFDNHALRTGLLTLLAAAACVAARAQPELGAASARHAQAASQVASSEQDSGAQPDMPAASFTAYCLYRYTGVHVIARCWDRRITANARVFAALGEYGANGPAARIMGAARMTVHNIVPFAGGVDVWTDVEWGAPLNVRLDLMVDP